LHANKFAPTKADNALKQHNIFCQLLFLGSVFAHPAHVF